MALADIPFVLSLEDSPFYNHEIFPNHLYRRNHQRHHDALDLHTLGLIARLGAHARHLAAAKHGQLNVSPQPNYGNSKNAFEINLDVGLFQPEELSVKVVKDCVVIEGKHEEREDDHGHISRHFIRRYALPKNHDLDALVSTLSSDGVLSVRLPKPKEDEQPDERTIPIQQIGPSDLFLKNGNTNNTSNGKEVDK